MGGVNLDWYDYGFRFYDPALARFPSLDPKADAFENLSPYNYASNNPVTCIDLWGLQGLPARLIQDNQGHVSGYTSAQSSTYLPPPIIMNQTLKPELAPSSNSNISSIQVNQRTGFIDEATVGGGGFIVGGQTYRANIPPGSGFWEKEIHSSKNFSYPLELGPSMGRGTLSLSKKAVSTMQTNSITEIMNSAVSAESRSGGFLLGGGSTSGYSENGDFVYNVSFFGAITGFTFSNSNLNTWEPSYMRKKDSIKSAQENVATGAGANPEEFINYLKENNIEIE